MIFDISLFWRAFVRSFVRSLVRRRGFLSQIYQIESRYYYGKPPEGERQIEGGGGEWLAQAQRAALKDLGEDVMA